MSSARCGKIGIVWLLTLNQVGHAQSSSSYVRYVHGDLEAHKRGQGMALPILMFTTGKPSAESKDTPFFAIHRTQDSSIASLVDQDASYVVLVRGKRFKLDLAQAQRLNRNVGAQDIKLKYGIVSKKKGEYLVALPTKRTWPSGQHAYEGTFRWNPELRTLKFLGY